MFEWRDDEVERDWVIGLDQIADTPVAARGYARRNRIPVEPEERHGGRQHARALIVAFVQKLACGLRNDRMDATLAKMRRHHHQAERALDRTARVGKEGGNPGQCLVGFCVKHVQDGADKQ
jgi:hypothetical protein